jgi:hypothetical protein
MQWADVDPDADGAKACDRAILGAPVGATDRTLSKNCLISWG